MQKIIVEGTEIRIVGENPNRQYFSLTDIAKHFGTRTDQIISNWLRTRQTLEFLAVWETFNNPNFNSLNFEGIRVQAGLATFTLSVQDWTQQTNAVGIYAKAGRYGGTYAHQDIALEFCSYVEPKFKLFILKEYQRLQADESQRLNLEWDVRRLIAKTNYKIHTESIKDYLIPQRLQRDKAAGLFYASEADLLNLAIFGMTAKEWKDQNTTTKGNLRDNASIEQLLVLANLESLNAELIKMGLSHDERLDKLNDAAIYQMNIIVASAKLEQIEGQDVKLM
jgi:hypothetical protein